MEIVKKPKVRLAVDGHVLLQKEKTGVGWTGQHMIDALAGNPDVDVQINFVDFLGYRCLGLIKKYKSMGCLVKLCWWMPYSVYYKVFEKWKIPYYHLFGRKNDATLFFEYFVPYQVGTKVISYVHDVNHKVYPETMEAWNVRWLNDSLPTYCDRSDVIVTVSEFSKKEIEKYLGLPSEKIQVVYNGVDLEAYGREVSAQEISDMKKKYGIDGDYILYLGTLEPRKNIAVLIEAYNLMVKKKDRLPRLVIAGKKGWMFEHLFQMVSDYQLEDKVVFPGYIDAEDCQALLTGAEIFVFPSVYEGFGIPPLEAMACGTPVIVSDAASLPEVVGECGVLFRSGDAEDLCEKMTWLLADKEKQKAMISAGRCRVKEFTWQESAKRLAEKWKIM